MMQITYDIEVRPKDMAGVVPLPVRITFHRDGDGGYEWSQLELLIRGTRERADMYAVVTESVEIQDLVQIEYESDRLLTAMREHDQACDISAAE